MSHFQAVEVTALVSERLNKLKAEAFDVLEALPAQRSDDIAIQDKVLTLTVWKFREIPGHNT